MNTKNDLTQSGQSLPALPPTPRKRFRIEKLEERIAPAKGGKGGGPTKNCSLTGGPSHGDCF